MSRETPEQLDQPMWTLPPIKSVTEQYRERRRKQKPAAAAAITFVVGDVVFRLLRELAWGRLHSQW